MKKIPASAKLRKQFRDAINRLFAKLQEKQVVRIKIGAVSFDNTIV